MNIRVKIINGYTNEGVHELANIDNRMVWLYRFPLQITIVNAPVLVMKERRDYLDVEGEAQFGLPFLEGDLEKIEWT